MDASIAVNSPLMGQAGGPEARCSLLHMAAQKGWSRLVAALVAAGVQPGGGLVLSKNSWECAWRAAVHRPTTPLG